MSNDPSAAPNAAMELELLDEALDAWRTEIDGDNSDVESARDVLAGCGLDGAGQRKALALVVETWPTDPDNWPREPRMASPAAHLAMIVAGIGAELISGEPGDGSRLWSAYLHGPYRDERKAAFEALTRARDEEGQRFLLHEVPPSDRSQGLVPESMVDQARVIADSAPTAPQWVEVEDIGWVVFSQL